LLALSSSRSYPARGPLSGPSDPFSTTSSCRLESSVEEINHPRQYFRPTLFCQPSPLARRAKIMLLEIYFRDVSHEPIDFRMAPSRTTTVKSKHAVNKSGIRNSKNSTKPQGGGVSKQRKPPKSKAPPLKSSGGPVKKKRRIYTEKELGIPTLNMITPVGVGKPRGKKKGKIFVDDRVCHFPPLPVLQGPLQFRVADKTNPCYLGRNP